MTSSVAQGVYQIGDVYARSCRYIFTSGGHLLLPNVFRIARNIAERTRGNGVSTTNEISVMGGSLDTIINKVFSWSETWRIPAKRPCYQ